MTNNIPMVTVLSDMFAVDPSLPDSGFSIEKLIRVSGKSEREILHELHLNTDIITSYSGYWTFNPTTTNPVAMDKRSKLFYLNSSNITDNVFTIPNFYLNYDISKKNEIQKVLDYILDFLNLYLPSAPYSIEFEDTGTDPQLTFHVKNDTAVPPAGRTFIQVALASFGFIDYDIFSTMSYYTFTNKDWIVSQNLI